MWNIFSFKTITCLLRHRFSTFKIYSMKKNEDFPFFQWKNGKFGTILKKACFNVIKLNLKSKYAGRLTYCDHMNISIQIIQFHFSKEFSPLIFYFSLPCRWQGYMGCDSIGCNLYSELYCFWTSRLHLAINATGQYYILWQWFSEFN